MKKILIPIFYLFPIMAMSQKVTTEVIKVEKAALSEWQIMDDQYHPVFSGNEYYREDSVFFTLEANRRYLLEISVNEIYYYDTILYTLLLDGEPIIMIGSEIGTGDHFYPFFTGIKTEQNKITGGTNADISDFPWQVFYESGDYLCGGSIIDENWIVTAAHCTENDDGSSIPANKMAVKVGATNPYNVNQGKIYYVSDVIVHSGYNSKTLENDIALLKIKGPINNENATPIKLISADNVADGATDPGVMAWVTGWGLTRIDPETYPETLQKVQLPIVSNTQASAVWKTIPSTDIMAGYLNGNKDACSGDSGGPLVVPVFDENKLAGIVSWGSDNCNTYGGYTRVSDLLTWIRTNTGIPPEYIPPAPEGDTIICQGTYSSTYSSGDISGATAYEWKLLPSSAGNITVNSGSSVVLWNPDYTGLATLFMKVTVNNRISEWSTLNIRVALNTQLMNQSGDTILCAGQPISLISTATGDNLYYSWYQNGTIVQSGSSGILNIVSASAVNSGEYYCRISGTCGSLYSRDISLTVHPLTRITYFSPDTEVDFGGDVTLEVAADGYALNFQWEKDKKLLDNSNGSGLFLQNLNANDIGIYQSIVTGYCGTETSDPSYLYVKKTDYLNEPEVFLWPAVTSGQFNVALSNDENYNIRIFSIAGMLMKEVKDCRYQTAMDISNLGSGIYIVNIYNKTFVQSKKLIKTQ